ncbi:MAG: Gfo/Idh/MocA family oxidoreductase [Gemmatimonadetes bacterium]|nr:Gfo/Idh/MocA family oxidoreductase [Gemmatimonadota bacterium]
MSATESGDVRLAVVGTGAIAQVVHLPVLTRMPRCQVVAVCDVDAHKARTIADRFKVPRSYTALDALLDGERDLDAVLVCTPNHLHAMLVETALRAGKHVICERPLATRAEDVRRLLDAAKAAGRHLLLALNHRFRPDTMALRHFVESGDLGEIFYLRAGWLNRGLRQPTTGWRRTQRLAGGGVLMDLGIQALDLAFWMLHYPAPDRVTAYTRRGRGAEVEDSAVVLLQMKTGVTMSLEVTWELIAARDRHTLYVLGTHGSGSISPFAVHREGETGILDVTPPLPEGKENVYTASYREELAYFLSVLRGERTADLPVDQEILMRVIEACYRSAVEGHGVVM